MDGHYITVQRVGDKTFNNAQSVFVGNLPHDVKEDKLRDHFMDCGTITGIRIIRDAKSGMGKGFGFVAFNTSDEVMIAIEKNDSMIDGRPIRVYRAGVLNKMSKNTLNMKRRLDKKMMRGGSQQKTTAADGQKKRKSTPDKQSVKSVVDLNEPQPSSSSASFQKKNPKIKEEKVVSSGGGKDYLKMSSVSSKKGKKKEIKMKKEKKLKSKVSEILMKSQKMLS